MSRGLQLVEECGLIKCCGGEIQKVEEGELVKAF